MGNFRTAQNTFLGGILGENAYGRTDTDAYKGGAAVLDNCIPTMSGSLTKTPPTTLTYPKDLLEDANYTGQFTLVCSFEDINLGTLYFVTARRVAQNPTTLAWSDPFIISGTTGTHYAVGYYYPIVAAEYNMPNAYIQFTTPSIREVLPITVGDITFLFCDNYPPHILVKAQDGGYYVAPWDRLVGSTGLAQNAGIAGITQTWAMYPYMAASADGSKLKLLSSKTILEGKTVSGIGLFKKSSIYYAGRYVKINNGANTSVFLVKSKLSDTQLSVEYILGSMVDNNISDDYAFSYYGANIFPTSACLFQGRLVLSGFGMASGYDLSSLPTPKVFFSRSGNLFTFMQDRLLQSTTRALDASNGNVFLYGDLKDDWPVVLSIASNEYAFTSFVQSGTSGVFVGTSGGLFSVSGNDGGPITPTSFTLQKVSEVYCAPVYPAFIDGSLFFAGSDGELLFTRYSEEGGGNSIAYATALFRPFKSILAMCYDETLDALCISGSIGGLSYRPIAIVAFSKIGNSLSWSLYHSQDLTKTPEEVDLDSFRTIYAIPRNGRYLYSYLKGNHPTGGATGLVRMSTTVYQNANADIVQSAEANWGVINVPFYNGRTVHVYRRNVSGVGGNATVVYTHLHTGTVSGNQILVPSLQPDEFTYNLAVGLPTSQNFESLPIVDGGNVGSADMARKRIDRVFLRVRNATQDVKIGTVDGGMAPLFGNEKPSPYSGVVEVSLLSGQGDDAKVRIENNGPYAFELLSMVTRGVTFD